MTTTSAPYRGSETCRECPLRQPVETESGKPVDVAHRPPGGGGRVSPVIRSGRGSTRIDPVGGAVISSSGRPHWTHRFTPRATERKLVARNGSRSKSISTCDERDHI